MNTGGDWKTTFKRELEQAEVARAAGLEGRARVCARRAAGIVVREYFRRQGIDLSGSSVYQQLQYLQNNAEIKERVREVAGYFLARVTEEHDLPVETDLLEESRWLASKLLQEST